MTTKSRYYEALTRLDELWKTYSEVVDTGDKKMIEAAYQDCVTQDKLCSALYEEINGKDLK